MRSSIKRIVTILFLLLPLAGNAQEFLWNAELLPFFDNREYKSRYQQPQTLFGVRLSPEIGVGVDENRHRIMAGVSWVQPIGGSWNEGTLRPTLYYRYSGRAFQMSFGAFPRTQLRASQPDFLVYDSLLYFRPNIQGALFQYGTSDGFVEAYLDWRGKQTYTRREAFLISAQGEWTPTIARLGGHFQLNHLARTKNAADGNTVIDDILVHPYAGVDLSSLAGLDSLSIRIGFLYSLQRDRGVDVWQQSPGLTVDFCLEWRWVGIRNFFYTGNGLYPLYPQYGAELNQGDPYYQAKIHNTSRVYFYLFRHPFVNCMASFNIHCNDHKIDLQQQLVLRFSISNFTIKQRPKEPLRSLF